MSQEGVPKAPSELTPEEKASANRSRLLSDAEKVISGADVDAEGKVLFTEQQIESARHTGLEDPIYKNLSESDRRAEMVDELAELEKMCISSTSFREEIVQEVQSRMTKRDVEMFIKGDGTSIMPQIDFLLNLENIIAGSFRNLRSQPAEFEDMSSVTENLKKVLNRDEWVHRVTDHTIDVIVATVANNKALKRMLELRSFLKKSQ